MTIFSQALQAGVEIDHHSSDLYLLVTPASRKLVAEYEYARSVTVFTSDLDGRQWFDVPFAYEPFWDEADEVLATWAHHHAVRAAQ